MLDYNIMTYSERLIEVEKILNTCDNIEKLNIEKLGTYLLMADDDKRIRKKENIIIYTNRELFMKTIKEKHVDTNFIIFVDEKNWKVEKKQQITSLDKKREILKDYWQYIVIAKKEIEIESKIELHRRKINNICNEIIYDMKIIKDKLLGTIYFKHIGDESTEYDTGSLIDYNNIDHIMMCLKLKSRDLTKWVGCIYYDINNILKQIKLTTKQEEILKEWRIDGSTFISVGEELNVTYQMIQKQLKLISKKIQKKIEHTK